MGGRQRYVAFAVGSSSGPRSSAWSVVSHKGNVYVSTLDVLAGVLKFSFHESGRCRYAFTEQYGTPPTLPDRAMNKWTRKVTPPSGSGLGTRVLGLYFPTDFLSTAYA